MDNSQGSIEPLLFCAELLISPPSYRYDVGDIEKREKVGPSVCQVEIENTVWSWELCLKETINVWTGAIGMCVGVCAHPFLFFFAAQVSNQVEKENYGGNTNFSPLSLQARRPGTLCSSRYICSDCC